MRARSYLTFLGQDNPFKNKVSKKKDTKRAITKLKSAYVSLQHSRRFLPYQKTVDDDS